MGQNNVELRKQKNGGAILAYWDLIHGKDVIIQLYPDGMATVRDELGIERECTLARELIKLAGLICE